MTHAAKTGKTYTRFQMGLMSLIPGVGHLATGHPWKALSLFVMDTGLVIALVHSKSWQTSLIVFSIFFFLIMIPMAYDAFKINENKGEKPPESQAYIVLLLLCRGCWALPMLWQCNAFSKRKKIAWSVAVPTLAILWLSTLFYFRVPIIHIAERWFDVSALKGIAGE
jgi:hypothetical protein